jgi:hypothetical protein
MRAHLYAYIQDYTTALALHAEAVSLGLANVCSFSTHNIVAVK